MTVSKQALAPALYMIAAVGNKYAVANFSDGVLVAPSGLLPASAPARAAKPGDVVGIWATGLGQTVPAYPDGQVITVQNRGRVQNVTVTVGGKNATIDFCRHHLRRCLSDQHPHSGALAWGRATGGYVNGAQSQPTAYLYIGQ
jgi:uncharacterized protein (TIGR03437 family)